MLSCLLIVIQAAVLDCQFFDLFSPFKNDGIALDVSVVGRDVAKALVASAVVGMVHKGFDLAFEVSGQIVVSSRIRFLSV